MNSVNDNRNVYDKVEMLQTLLNEVELIKSQLIDFISTATAPVKFDTICDGILTVEKISTNKLVVVFDATGECLIFERIDELVNFLINQSKLVKIEK